MDVTPFINRITIYPVKSLDGVELQSAVITEGGCLLHDREYAITDEQGNFVIGKTNKLVHSLRTFFDLENETVSFRQMNDTAAVSFHLQKERSAITSYLTDYFGMTVLLNQNKTGRFMDVPDDGGVTVISTSSLHEVSGWFDNMKPDEARKRFRATIEIEGVPAFWEDHLFSAEGRRIEFRAGDVTMFGMSPRERCVVPTRNPETGEVIHAFPKTFAKLRASTLPQWSRLNEFDHYYYLSVDCSIPASEIGKTIETGDEISIVGERNH
jgi:uncharacterized protein YcbX